MMTQALLGEYKAIISVNHDNSVEPRDNMKTLTMCIIEDV